MGGIRKREEVGRGRGIAKEMEGDRGRDDRDWGKRESGGKE